MQAFVCNSEGIPVSDTLVTLQVGQGTKATRGCLSPVELGKRLLVYSRDGDTEEVKNLISRGAPFTTDWLGVSPLHLAAQMGHTETAEVLLRGGISRDARTKVDRTPLHIAAQEGHTGIVSLLLDHGAEVDSEDMLRMTPLHWAVERGHTDTVLKLLENGANPNAISKFDKTPVLIAVDQNRVDLLDILQNNAIYAINKDQSGGDNFLSQLDEADSAAENLVVELGSSDSNVVNQEEEVQTTHTAVYDSKHQSIKFNFLNSSDKMKPKKNITAGASTSTSQSNIQFLRAHGITMIPADDSNLVASAMESGQTVVLTEAGKLALNLTRNPTMNKKICVASPSKIPQRKVVTITADQLAALTGKIAKVTPLHKKNAKFTINKNVDANSSRVITTTTGKRVFPSSGTSSQVETKNSELQDLESIHENEVLKSDNDLRISDTEDNRTSESELKNMDDNNSDNAEDDLASMSKKLAQAKKEAEEYRQQLLKKEQEAEEYMKKLQSLTK